jgi:hypothetical protein
MMAALMHYKLGHGLQHLFFHLCWWQVTVLRGCVAIVREMEAALGTRQCTLSNILWRAHCASLGHKTQAWTGKIATVFGMQIALFTWTSLNLGPPSAQITTVHHSYL